MKTKFLAAILLVGLYSNAQDVSGAVVGAISTTLHTDSPRIEVQKPNKKLYVLQEDIKLENTYIKYKSVKYQVFKTPKGVLYFYYNGKKKYFK